MNPVNPFLGVFFHSVGGFAAGTFYLPLKKVRDWSWESAWLVNGLFAWLIVPWVIALVTVKDLGQTLADIEWSTLGLTYLFGLLWGIGGLTFGMTMRYLGMSLGMAVALGLTAAFGTLVPPLFNGTFDLLVTTRSGWIVLLGVLVCLVGISVCGRAGVLKDRELTAEQKTVGIAEFDLKKGLLVAIISGTLSACFAFGIEAGRPIAELSVQNGTPALWSNGAVFVVILLGGLTSNAIYCIHRIWRSGAGAELLDVSLSLRSNYIFAALAGITWYCQFMFYGMGTTQMGTLDFTSWTLHMAFIIIFSTLWGLVTREWKGASRKTISVLVGGLSILILSTIIIGAGNQIATNG